MADVLGLILFAVYIVAIISVAASVTWLVVRITPTKKPAPPAPSETA
jgi:hypothetical protein